MSDHDTCGTGCSRSAHSTNMNAADATAGGMGAAERGGGWVASLGGAS